MWQKQKFFHPAIFLQKHNVPLRQKKVLTMSFAHLHVHTDYSVDGIARIPKLFAEAERLGLQGLAITDHGTMAGVPAFLREAEKPHVSATSSFSRRTSPDTTILSGSAPSPGGDRTTRVPVSRITSWSGITEGSSAPPPASAGKFPKPFLPGTSTKQETSPGGTRTSSGKTSIWR